MFRQDLLNRFAGGKLFQDELDRDSGTGDDRFIPS